ncbi:MAG: CopD family protein [Saprospiraceae bacterium]|nr:CopD family protein [Saprospiraceae bacterium]
MWLLFFKSLHIISFVAWFAGLFYLVRLFVYYREADMRSPAEKQVLQDQLMIMQKRLFKIITQPAMIITWIAGISMIIIQPAYLEMGWLHMKLVLLILLSFYHFRLPVMIRQLEAGRNVMSSFQFRLYNELPTLFLIGIVPLAVFKNLADYLIVIFVLFLQVYCYLYLLNGTKNKELPEK